MSCPTADIEKLRVTAEWVITIFAWDDPFDSPEGDLMEDSNGVKKLDDLILSVFDHPGMSETQAGIPIVVAIRAFWDDFCATSTPAVQKRFVDAVRQSAQGFETLVRNREKRRVPGVEEFLAMRRATSAAEPCSAFVEYNFNIEVPDKAFYHAATQDLRDAINDIISWTNDLYSFNKEQAVGDYQNLIAVVAIEKDIDVQSAIQYVFAMIQSAVNHYFEARARIPEFDAETDKLISEYIRGIECLCSGVVHWNFETDRYFVSKPVKFEDKLAIVKVLPREKDARDPGFQLKYNTPSSAAAS